MPENGDKLYKILLKWASGFVWESPPLLKWQVGIMHKVLWPMVVMPAVEEIQVIKIEISNGHKK